MIGKLYNTKYGWTIIYSQDGFEKKNDSYGIVVIPISNEEVIDTIENKNKVKFNLIFRYDEIYDDSIPFAEINTN